MSRGEKVPFCHCGSGAGMLFTSEREERVTMGGKKMAENQMASPLGWWRKGQKEKKKPRGQDEGSGGGQRFFFSFFHPILSLLLSVSLDEGVFMKEWVSVLSLWPWGHRQSSAAPDRWSSSDVTRPKKKSLLERFIKLFFSHYQTVFISQCFNCFS